VGEPARELFDATARNDQHEYADRCRRPIMEAAERRWYGRDRPGFLGACLEDATFYTAPLVDAAACVVTVAC
jgi:hypothetical protein